MTQTYLQKDYNKLLNISELAWSLNIVWYIIKVAYEKKREEYVYNIQLYVIQKRNSTFDCV